MPFFRYIFINVYLLVASAFQLGAEATDLEFARYKLLSKLPVGDLFERGQEFFEQEGVDSALIYYNILSNTYPYLVNSREKRMAAIANLNSGIIYYRHFNYSQAMESYLKCRRICEENKFRDILCDVSRAIGNIYSIHNDYEQSIEFYTESLALAREVNDVSLQHKAVSNLVGAYALQGENDKAEEYFRLLLSLPSNEEHYRYDIALDGGIIEFNKGEMNKALIYFKDAAANADEMSLDVSRKGAANSYLAMLFEQIGNSDSTLYYLHANEALARRTNKSDLLVSTLGDLSRIYKSMGNMNRSQEYQEEYLTLSDEVFNKYVFNSLKNTQFQYEIDRTNRFIENLNEDRLHKEMRLKWQTRLLVVVSVGVLCLVMLSFIIYRKNRRLSTAYQDLFRRNKENLESETLYKARIRKLEDHLLDISAEKARARNYENSNPVSLTFTNDFSERLKADIEKAMDDIEMFCDPEFSINRLAQAVNSNTTYISKIINETYGKNFRSYLNEYRIKESMMRLADPAYFNFTIKAIAESVGFKSQSSFIAAFTKFTGMKPSIYQEMVRSQSN